MINEAQKAQQKIAAAEAAGLTEVEIEVDEEVLAKLDTLKLHKDESYNDVLHRLMSKLKNNAPRS